MINIKSLNDRLSTISEAELDTLAPSKLHLIQNYKLSDVDMVSQGSSASDAELYIKILMKAKEPGYMACLLRLCQWRFGSPLIVRTDSIGKHTNHRVRVKLIVGKLTLIEGICPETHSKAAKNGLAYLFLKLKMPLFIRLYYLKLCEPGLDLQNYTQRTTR